MPPAVVMAACRREGRPIPLAQQAKEAGLSIRHLTRLAGQGWDHWNIGRARAWCRCCGFDLLDLKVNGSVPLDPASPRGRKAILAILKAAGVRPTEHAIRRVANLTSASATAP